MEPTEYRVMFGAEGTHWWYVSLHELILRNLPPRDDLRIFDAGCGTGGLLQLLRRRGDASGCDWSAVALDFCRQRGLRDVSHCDLNELDLPASTFDAITSIDVIYHRDVTDERRVLIALHRALKPGGTLILQVPAYEWMRSEHDRAVHTARRYTKTALVNMLCDSGFIVQRATYRCFFLFLPIMLVRLTRNGLVRLRGCGNAPRSDVALPSPITNALLSGVQRVENLLLRHLSLPFGTSVFAVARKPETA